MINIFYDVINAFTFLDESVFFSLSFIAAFLLGVANLFLSVFKTGYGAIKKLRYLFFLFSLCAIDLFYCIVKPAAPYFLVTLFLGFLFFSVSFGIREKRPKPQKDDTDRSSELKVIDLAEKALYQQSPETRTVKEPFYREVPPEKPKTRPALDVSHVKSVIERLSYFPLTAGDRRQINELNSLILTAEREGDAETMRALNEKLSSLLKLMAKYGA